MFSDGFEGIRASLELPAGTRDTGETIKQPLSFLYLQIFIALCVGAANPGSSDLCDEAWVGATNPVHT